MRNTKKNQVSVFLFLFFFQFFLAPLCHAVDRITVGESIRDGQYLISDNEVFQLGFFSPNNSSSQYLGIWYHKIEPRTVVWVANRDRPISDRSGVLTIGDDGNLVVLDGNNNTVWWSNVTASTNTTARLAGSGNLVLSGSEHADDSSGHYWQSFDHPTDTYLPSMRVRVNAAVRENRAFTSWKSPDDPSPGSYTMGVDSDGAPEIVIWNGDGRRWRSGQWNSAIFTGVPNMSSTTNYIYGFKLSSPPEADGSVYFTYVPADKSDLLRFQITWDGKEEQLRWNNQKKNWSVMQSEPVNDCEVYNFCGNFGICDSSDSRKCSCMDGYQPRFDADWKKGNWSGGCKQRTQFKCQRNNSLTGREDGFRGLKSLKLPDFEGVVTLDDSESCSQKCLKNCSCTAYADVAGIGCMIWTGDLIDIQRFSKGGSTLYIRLAGSELGGGSKRKISSPVIISVVVVGTFFLGLLILLLRRFRKNQKGCSGVSSLSCCKSENDIPVIDMNKSREFSTDFSGSVDLLIEGNDGNGPELPMFNFNFLAAATNNFSEENKLGQGGFGSVYKGKLPGGQEIAVKRLSGRSGQGSEEFKNEILLIAKLQHRNLVRLLGYCIQGEEKMLIYEYMPNKSLDYYLFEEAKRSLLDWKTRFAIIEGVARGLLYLHRDSRLRIIHRDMKASNILLDAEMNPKISDFGMARIFGGNQNEANTVRVVGTYGYMSPEYAMEGLFSVKSDVYSFGVLLLEIASGHRNTNFRTAEHCSLIGYAWHVWNQGRAMELVDPSIRDSCDRSEVLKCIHVGMLCVQDSPLNRPNMAAVVLMLESETPTLPLPRQPTYTSMRRSVDAELILEGQDIASSNDMTVTMVVGR